MGVKFSEIIRKAKDLSKYNKLEEDIQLMTERITLKFFIIGCSSIICLFIIWRICQCVRT